MAVKKNDLAHYTPFAVGTPGTPAQPTGPTGGIVTHVWPLSTPAMPEANVNLSLFCNLADPRAILPAVNIPYSAEHEPGTWAWTE